MVVVHVAAVAQTSASGVNVAVGHREDFRRVVGRRGQFVSLGCCFHLSSLRVAGGVCERSFPLPSPA
ncbi:unnamed protein product, partial [Citrullus colocynthis]